MIMFVLLAIRCSLVDHHLKVNVAPYVAGMMVNHVMNVKIHFLMLSNLENWNFLITSSEMYHVMSLTW